MRIFLIRMIMILKIIYYKVTDWVLGRKPQKKDVEVEFGELCVSGSDSTEIDLPILPRVIEVKFKHNHHHVPCDHYKDELKYKLVRNHHQYKLVIEWDVSTLREVSWIAYF